MVAELAGVCAALLMLCPLPPGYALPFDVPHHADPTRPRTAGDARRAPWHSSAALPCPPPHMTHIVCVGVPCRSRGVEAEVAAQGVLLPCTSAVG